jgi:periplasmic protein TonB
MELKLKNKYHKLTLDDIAFVGRNKAYGAYIIRKTYHARVLCSFIYSLCFFLCALLLFERIGRIRSENAYYNSLSDLQVVGVNLSKNPYPSITIEQTKGASAPEPDEVPVIVADDAGNDEPCKTNKTNVGSSDSLAISGKGTIGSGEIDDAGGGIVGEIYGSAEKNPQFPGGDKAMQEFIRQNLHYPEIARIQNITGIIHVYLVILKDGTIRYVKVVRGLQPDLDIEVARVIRSMPVWNPGMRGGIAVNVRCIIPVTVSPLKHTK